MRRFESVEIILFYTFPNKDTSVLSIELRSRLSDNVTKLFMAHLKCYLSKQHPNDFLEKKNYVFGPEIVSSIDLAEIFLDNTPSKRRLLF